jgi:uncharacterized protein YukE
VTNGFEVSPDQIRSSAKQLKQVADDFTQKVADFEAKITGFGEPWGGDDIGMLIGIAHGAVFEAAMECFKENAKELTERTQALEAMATNYTRMEDANSAAVNSVSKALG